MTHDCRSLLCDTPHYENDDHEDGCLCELCHTHDFQQYTAYPAWCDGCLKTLSQWIHECTDLKECQFPELCDYGPGCPIYDARIARRRRFERDIVARA